MPPACIEVKVLQNRPGASAVSELDSVSATLWWRSLHDVPPWVIFWTGVCRPAKRAEPGKGHAWD